MLDFLPKQRVCSEKALSRFQNVLRNLGTNDPQMIPPAEFLTDIPFVPFQKDVYIEDIEQMYNSVISKYGKEHVMKVMKTPRNLFLKVKYKQYPNSHILYMAMRSIKKFFDTLVEEHGQTKLEELFNLVHFSDSSDVENRNRRILDQKFFNDELKKCFSELLPYESLKNEGNFNDWFGQALQSVKKVP